MSLSTSSRKFNLDLIAIALLVVLVSFFFGRTIFGGQSISKLGMLYTYDSLFNPNMKQPIFECLYDPGCFESFFAPSHFEMQTYAKGEIPLWNPLSGCGFPLIGDPESHLFSIYNLFPAFSLPRAYDLYDVFKVAVAAV